ncbi:DgyrCDS9139 [Dimorphilus gyrociliatus]|uniref:DgyrCDS9139 n=1 Tax=Dimorphilus gyrociliatus TaxID=2664684 RepID=A0A7I8VWH6_9ANNE|nr:DgyrCDS9139 [Dimorphilus gyrociliatus]
MHHILKKPSPSMNILKIKFQLYKSAYFEKIPTKKLAKLLCVIFLVSLVIYCFYPRKRYTSAIGCKTRIAEMMIKDSGERRRYLDGVGYDLFNIEDSYFRTLSTITTMCESQERIGPPEDGGWDICLDASYRFSTPCLVYSFGIDNDFRFEEGIEDRFGCEVHAFDPSMNKEDYQYSDSIYFHNIGIDHENGLSIMGNWRLKTFGSILKELGHEDRHIDYLKLDVEFSEWPALYEMIKSGSIHKIRQLAVEFHTPEMDIHTKPNNKCTWAKGDTLRFMYRVILELKNTGFRKEFPPQSSGYYWRCSLDEAGFEAACSSNFKHLSIAELWQHIKPGVLVEVVNTDPAPHVKEPMYWIASIVKISGLYLLLRYESEVALPNLEFWTHFASDDLHFVGWCAENGANLSPPNSIIDKTDCWESFLFKRLDGAYTIPRNFRDSIKRCLELPNGLKVGMNVEILNKVALDTMLPGRIKSSTGGRLHIDYICPPAESKAEEDGFFYCHYLSPVLHPVGWCENSGHAMDPNVPALYRHLSSQKVSNAISYDDKDASPEMFPQQVAAESKNDIEFEEGMKLEAINPFKLSEITVASVSKLLDRGNMMISFDVNPVMPGRDWFCYHKSSPCLLPAGYCDYYGLDLTPPLSHKENFDWQTYLNDNAAKLAPVKLFDKELPAHTFKEGQKLEAADLISPHLVCVATVHKIAGRLLRIRFDGWSEAYDQWVDCESSDIYPIGWCEMVGHTLEVPPGSAAANGLKENTITGKGKGNRKKRSTIKRRKSSVEQNSSIQHDKSALSESTLPRPIAPKAVTHPALVSALSPFRSIQLTKNIPKYVEDDTDESSIMYTFAPGVDQQKIDPLNWTVEDVVVFLKRNDCGNLAESFSKKGIDGKGFLSLKKEDMSHLAGIKVSTSLKIYNLIQHLKDVAGIK